MDWNYIKKVVFYIVINTSFAASAWYGIAQGVEWASNLFMFMCGFFLVSSIIFSAILFLYRIILENGKLPITDQMKLTNNNNLSGRLFAVHENVDVIYDICLIAFIVSYGWTGFGVILAITSVLQYTIKKNVKYVAKFVRESVSREEHEKQETEQRMCQTREDDERMTWDSDSDGNDDLRRMGVLIDDVNDS